MTYRDIQRHTSLNVQFWTVLQNRGGLFNAATRSTRIASSAERRYANSASTSPFGKSRLRAIDLSASFRASYLPAVAASSPHTIATAPDAVTFSRSTVSAFRSTALTCTSAGVCTTGASGNGAGYCRSRKATTTAAAISSAVPQTITITRFVIVQFDSPTSFALRPLSLSD